MAFRATTASTPPLSDAGRQTDLPTSGKGTSPQRQRWKLRAVWIASGGVAVIAAAAPYLAALYVSSRGVQLRGENSEVVRVDVGDASFGWLSPAVLSDVVVRDLDGFPLAHLAKLTSDRPLWRLVTDRSRPGRIRVSDGELTVIVRDDGTNLADVLRVLSHRRGQRTLSAVAFELTSGRVRVQDAAGAEVLQLDEVTVDVSDVRSTTRHFEFEFSGDAIQTEAGERFPLELAFEWTGPPASHPLHAGRGRAGVTFAPLPLARLAPRLQMLFPELTLHEGHVGGKVLTDWDFVDKYRLQIVANVTVTNVRASLVASNGRMREIDWPAEELTVELDGDFRPQSREIHLAKVHVDSSPLALDATGRIADLRGPCDVDFTGELRYDLNAFVDHVSDTHREQLQVEGLRTRRFAIQGPLVSEVDGERRFDLSQLTMDADLGWDQANAFGVRSQASTLVARLNGGMLEIAPADVPVSGGRWTGVPRVDMRGSPAFAEVEPGVVLENIEFSPEMCHLWLKFLSPPMAQAASAEGRLSISLAESYLPLDQIAAGRLKGVLSIHSANVQPGPFAEQIISIVSAIEALIPGRSPKIAAVLGNVWIRFPAQDVDFQMVDGRVHHSRLEFGIGSLTVRTSGSVGLDETLDLMIEVPIPAEWLPPSLLEDTVKGEVLRIPLRGTFEHPHFDRSAITDFGKRLAVRAAGGLLRKLLGE